MPKSFELTVLYYFVYLTVKKNQAEYQSNNWIKNLFCSYLQLTDVEIFKIETEVPKPWPDHGLLPESKLTPVESYISSEMTEELTKPVKFTYVSVWF